jgi:hypothetical protein
MKELEIYAYNSSPSEIKLEAPVGNKTVSFDIEFVGTQSAEEK